MKLAVAGLGLALMMPVILIGALTGALGGVSAPVVQGAAWGGDVPAEMDALYSAAGARFGVPLGLLRAVGKVESDHGRNPLCWTPNSAGAVGPMQFLPSTFERWASASGSPAPSVTDPVDAVYAAAAKLAADGAGAADPTDALWAYNHSRAYVADVLGWAVAYGWRTPATAVLARAVLDHPRIDVRQLDRADLELDAVDGRLLGGLLALATRHRMASVGPFTRHSYFVKGTRSPSNHVFGRAVDVPVVGEAPVAPDNAAARRLVVDVLTLPADIRPNEVLSPWAIELDGAHSSTNSAHQGHVHLGFDD